MSTIIENPSITATVSRRGRPRRQYRCEYCAKSFKRSEHCIRHERTHTQEKPFVCRYCRKSYSRKDLVTRHERTLHADVHEQSLSRQRRRSDNQQEHQQATDRILDQVNVASLAPPQPSALETPPEENTGSLPEACESQNTPITAFLEGSAAQRDGDALSPSTTTSSSESNAVVEQGDGASWSSPSVVAHQNSEHEKQSFNYNSHIDTFSEVLSGQPIANMATTFTNDRTNFEDPRENDQARNAPTSPGIMPSDITGLVGTIDVMELDDTGMDMALNLHSTRPNAGPDDGNNHPPLSDALIHSGLYQDEALASYFPMPNIDLDFSAFSFTPTSVQIDIMDSHDLLPTLEVNNTFQASSHANFDRIVNAKRMNPTTAHSTQAVAPDSSYSSSLLNTSQPQKKDGNIPLLLRDKPQTSFTLSLDEPGRAQLCQDLAKRLDVIDTASDIPSLKLCQGFLSSYVTSFHGHFPLLHLPSFCVSRTPSPLVLAMCSIGALYRLDRRRARRYYDLASRAVSTVARPAPGKHSFVEEYCLWYVQARTLLSFYAIMSGEQDLVSKTMNENGFYTMVYNKTKAALTTDDVTSGRITWDHWIQHESWKRLISGQFIISTLTMVLFDVNPGFNSTRDLNFDLIDDENMWNAASSTEWKELRARQSQQAGLRRRSMMQALFDIILQGRHPRGDSEYHISAFSALVLMYAVVVHMWQRLQISHIFPLQAELPGHPGSSNHDLGPSLLDNAVQLMARCESFLQITENDHHPLESEGDAVTSLAFNCQAILRIARSMMFNTVRISLATFNPADMEASIVAFASTKLHRGPQLLDAVSKCLQGLSIPVKIGHMLIRKTAAFRWSVEHAIAAWENALLVTKWIHSIELDKARGVEPNKLEQEVLTSIVEVLEETECDVTTSVSLAAEVARTWGSFLQDVWVWDITPRMGKALEMVAQAYERANNKPRSSPLITQNAMIVSGVLTIRE